jgi:hypothetical protein
MQTPQTTESTINARANARLDYLNYDRLGNTGVHMHLADGDRDLHHWLEQYGLEPASHS